MNPNIRAALAQANRDHAAATIGQPADPYDRAKLTTEILFYLTEFCDEDGATFRITKAQVAALLTECGFPDHVINAIVPLDPKPADEPPY